MSAPQPAPGRRCRPPHWTSSLQPLALPAALLLIWQAWAATLPANTRAPSPARVIATFAELTASGDLVISTAQSLGRVIMGSPWRWCSGWGWGC